MKKSCTALCLLLSHFLMAQPKTFTARDGNTVTVSSLETNPDSLPKMSVSLGYFGMEGPRFLQVNYYQPKILFINAEAGIGNIMADASIFLFNTSKQKAVTHIGKQITGNDTRRFLVKIPVEKRISIGIHGGAGWVDFTQAINSPHSVQLTPYTTGYIVAGLTALRARNTHMLTENYAKPLRVHTVGRLNADIVIYQGRKFKGNLSAITRPLDEVVRKTGFRLYYQGRSSFYSGKGRFGYSYLFGAGLNSYQPDDYAIFGGLGIFYSFL